MKIEKGVEIPVINKNGGRPAIYPFKQMLPGDSVLFLGEKTGGKVYLAAMSHGKRHGQVFSGRSVDGGLRIWRIE